MTTLSNEMLQAIIVETVDTMPSQALAYYRKPPGRSPHAYIRRIQSAIAGMDDATAEMLIRDIVDSVVFQMLYLVSADYKSGIATTIGRRSESVDLTDSLLHEDYRQQVDPGGTRFLG